MNWRKPIVLALLRTAGSNIPHYMDEIARVDTLCEEEKKAYQEAKLKRLLLHAWQNVPYYHDALETAGAVVRRGNGADVRLERFDDIPFLTKDIVRQEGERLLARGYKVRKPYKNTSSGSTGEPLGFVQDQDYRDWNIANKLYLKQRHGQDIGERELRLWGLERNLAKEEGSLSVRARRWLRAPRTRNWPRTLEKETDFFIPLRDWLYNRVEIEARYLSDADLERYAHLWNHSRPTWVEGYAHSLHELAAYALRTGTVLHPPRGVVSSGGVLYAQAAQDMQRAFACPVYDRYGAGEMGDMAFGAASGELQLCVWNHYVEVAEGGVYATSLNNFSMPFIRYDMGDRATQLRWGYLHALQGRTVSIFKRADGALIDGWYFIHFFTSDWIRRFQIVQTGYDTLEATVVPHTAPDPQDLERIEKAAKEVMGLRCSITWRFVGDIPLAKNGKHLHVISQLP